ncbi:hypothetical protein MBH78_17970, partial [Oceanimonas sp. NS1]|nr:hypothetical protein [Oceanimonas sp. NS1]
FIYYQWFNGDKCSSVRKKYEHAYYQNVSCTKIITFGEIMARNLKVGDRVYVPCSKFSELTDQPSAFYWTKVVDIKNKSIKSRFTAAEGVRLFGMSLAHDNLGLLIISIGDFETETALLDPLSKSVLQYARLLMPDDALLYIKLRSVSELKTYWQRDQAAYTHVVLIGHGSNSWIKFGVDGWVTADQFQQEILRVWGGAKKTIISLCCQTGYKAFRGKLSSFAQCKYFMGHTTVFMAQ